MISFNIQKPDIAIATALQDKIDNLTKPKGSKPKKIIPNTGKEKAESEYLKQLEDENLRLRIENAYLKELRRLRLEEEKPPKNRQE